MHTHKYLNHITTPTKTLCILLMAIFLTGVIQLIVTQIWWEYSRTHTTPGTPPSAEKVVKDTPLWDIHDSVKMFDSDGTVYLVKTVSFPGTRQSKYIVKDRNNTTLFEGNEKDNPYEFIQWQPKTKNRYVHYQNINQDYLNELNLIGGEFSRHFVIPIVDELNHRVGHWIFNTDKRIFKYYSVTGQQLGYLGTNGYTKNKTDALGFEKCETMINWLRFNTYDPIMIYRTRYAVFQIDFENKQVKTLIKTNDDPIRHMRLHNWQDTEVYDYRPALAVFTESGKLYLHLKNPKHVIETQLPNDFPTYSTPMFAADGRTIFAEYQEILGYPKSDDWDVCRTWWRENQYKAKDHRIRLFELDKTGKFTEKSSFVWTEPARQPNIAVQSTREAIYYTVNSLSSPIPGWITMHWLKTGDYRQAAEWIQGIMEFIREYSVFKLPINLCVMTVFAILSLLHGWPRRTHIAKLVFWVAFVFLFNLPGLLTYLALNHTTVIHCAHCSKRRGLLQDVCCRCGTALPLPESKETDLVMPLSA